MRFLQLVSRTIACAVPAIVFATADVAVAAAQTRDGCPPIIASLLPKNASGCTGQYFVSVVSAGKGSADIPFEHRCITTRYPARISFEVAYFDEPLVELFRMEGTEPDEQIIVTAMEVLEGMSRSPTREKLAGGEIAYAEYMSNCPYEGPAVMAAVGALELPNVRLTGVTRTDNAKLEVRLEGQISIEAARAAITEVFENLRKVEFGKAR